MGTTRNQSDEVTRSREDLLYEDLRAAIKLKHDAKLAMIKADYEDMPQRYEEFKGASQHMNEALTTLSTFMGTLISVDESGVIYIGDRGELDSFHD
jgi:hypothetical protein